ncbi:MAG: hypothetical protein J6Y71_03445 [Ruminococcus sp.]|nr:hypothetical protein [Ruminococcus sp.]
MKKNNLNHLLSLITSFSLILSVFHYCPNIILETHSDNSSEAATMSEDSITDLNESLENPFNNQDDEEVTYDKKSWVQPKEWNSPKIDPKDYKGNIMLFFDKLGLEPGGANGKVQRVYFSVTGATEPVSHVKFHFFYDTRLKVQENSYGDVVTAGKALNGFTTGSKMIEEGQIVFYAYSEDTIIDKGSIFTVDFIVPEDAGPGEVYPFGISYVDDGIAYDSFINSEKDDAGKLQMTYVFTKGIFNGYIRMNGEKPTTTTSATPPEPLFDYYLGDVNDDGKIDAKDASMVLAAYAKASTGEDNGLTDMQKESADVNIDARIDAKDASLILEYYAIASTFSC